MVLAGWEDDVHPLAVRDGGLRFGERSLAGPEQAAPPPDRLHACSIAQPRPQGVEPCQIMRLLHAETGSVRNSMAAAVMEEWPDVLVVTDARGRIQYVNRAFEALTGYRRYEVL